MYKKFKRICGVYQFSPTYNFYVGMKDNQE